jgi:DNA-3-methyladenine glycosylase
VLIRAAAVSEGRDRARARRGPVPDHRLAAGPGNLALAFGIDRRLDGADLVDGPVRIGPRVETPRVAARPRIGVGYAREWAARPLRFVIPGDPRLSRP